MRQRGVILVSALLITALAAVVAAALFFDTGLAARRAQANFSLEQALQVAQGAEALAAEVLREDRNQTDTPQDTWAQAVDPVEIVEDSVVIEARLSDLTARFNINSLVNADGEPDENAMKVFRRLLELLELDERATPLAQHAPHQHHRAAADARLHPRDVPEAAAARSGPARLRAHHQRVHCRRHRAGCAVRAA
jgi:type II secretory pathway component PulK